MTLPVTRRMLLAALAAGAADRALAAAPGASLRPTPRPGGAAPPPRIPEGGAELVAETGLSGAASFLVANALTGAPVDALNPDLRLPPASVAKAATAYYALSRLGAAHRFETRLLATGPLRDGRIEGDLILQGGGDPTLDTDALAAMASVLKARGVHEVRGRFRVDASALPTLPHIDPDQPPYVAYNPAISGLCLNYNRVHFGWTRADRDYEVTMQARAREFSPDVRISTMKIADRRAPVYTYKDDDGLDRWTVARGALGSDGARWLPVRRPTEYAADVFQSLARFHGIQLRRGPDATGATGEVLTVNRSDPLSGILRDMLTYSTNLTAEAVGLAATRETAGPAPSLIRSARAMNLWFNRSLGARACGFVDHSGLGYGNRVSAADMVRVLSAAYRAGLLPTLLKEVRSEAEGADVRAKTGTLNFVNGLAGYVDAPGAPPLVFAVFLADLPRRDAIPVEARVRPPGSRGWANRARHLERRLIGRWAEMARG